MNSAINIKEEIIIPSTYDEDENIEDDRQISESEDTGHEWEKEEVRTLINLSSNRIDYVENDHGHADVWKRFKVVHIDGRAVDFVKCNTCVKIFNWTSRMGTASMNRHRCGMIGSISSTDTGVALVEDDSNEEYTDNVVGDRSMSSSLEIPKHLDNWSKEDVSNLIKFQPDRISYVANKFGQASVWKRFKVVYIDGRAVDFVKCNTCVKIFNWTSRMGTASMNRHRCGILDPNFAEDSNLEYDACVDNIGDDNQSSLLGISKTSGQLTRGDVSRLICLQSDRISLEENKVGQANVWKRFKIVYIDGKAVDFVKCNDCVSVFHWTSRTGTASLNRHRCISNESTLSVTSENSVQIANIDGDIGNEFHERAQVDEQTVYSASNSEIKKPWAKEELLEMIKLSPDRVEYVENKHGQADVWKRFKVINIDGMPVDYVSCNSCLSIFNWTSRSGTSTMNRHRCKTTDTAEHDNDDYKPNMPSKISGIRTRSTCLFCMRCAPKELSKFQKKVPGAGCSTLEKHLQVFFIVHKLLDVPSSWSESVLGNGRFPNLQDWVRICEQCFSCIEDAWRLHQELIAVQCQINEIKEGLKQKIKASQTKLTSRQPNDLMSEIRNASISSTNHAFAGTQETTEGFGSSEETGDNEHGDHPYSPDTGSVTFDTDFERPRKRKTISRCSASTSGQKKKKYKPLYPLRCSICPAKFEENHQEKLNDHMKAHDRCKYSNSEFVCKQCKFPSESEAELERHTKIRHPKSAQRKEKKCTQCSYVTFKQSRLDKHIKSKHLGISTKSQPLEQDLICSICGKKTGNLSALGRHKRIEHPELFGKKLNPNAIMECDECGEKFDNLIRFEYHKNLHKRKKDPNSYKYTCEVCGSGFRYACRLQAHMTNHGATREWMCSLCGIDFTFKHSLTKHLHTHHPEQFDPARINPKFARKRDDNVVECKICHIQIPVAFRRRHMKTHLDPDKAYKCDECDRSYFKLQGLKKHKEINHSNGASKVNCPYCNKEFIHQEYLKWHYRYCHLKKAAEETKHDPESLKQQQQPQYESIVEDSVETGSHTFEMSSS